MVLLSCLGLSGCYPTAQGPMDEEKNPYFIEGKARVAARDYKGAIEAFEKAAEENPRSGLAHFELGVLYEQHSEQTENDYVTAMYHYQQAMKLRPNAYPYDNARLRMASCKQELVKAESLAPVYQAMQRELERLKEENAQLRKQLEAWLAQPGARPPGPGTPTLPPARQNYSGLPTSFPPASAWSTLPPRADATNRTPALTPGTTQRPAPASTAMRTHTVKAGETLASIARQYRVRLESLMAANQNVDPKRLKPGQTLNIPAS